MSLKVYYFAFCLIANSNIKAQNIGDTINQVRDVVSQENWSSDYEENEDEIGLDFEEDMPRPVFHQPSEFEVLVRTFGINIMLAIFDMKNWCCKKYKNFIQALKVVRYTL